MVLLDSLKGIWSNIYLLTINDDTLRRSLKDLQHGFIQSGNFWALRCFAGYLNGCNFREKLKQHFASENKWLSYFCIRDVLSNLQNKALRVTRINNDYYFYIIDFKYLSKKW